ncbi:MAG: hypothetical protein GY855_15230 [candidate division Zixibacteria bacterium]|nr:hypothetical protein [candidate division Zixibacteria bacterium]
MALRINHNITALDAWRNLTMTTNSMSKSMEKLSSGFRINRAADDPAGLVISEQFRAQIAGLNAAVKNSEGSINMIQTAEGALTEINNLLVGMRELAIHAANEGFNDQNQLLADQAEITNAIKTINRIASNTQFGTKKLLDGSTDNVAAITTGNSSGLNTKESNLTSGTHSITAVKLSDSSGSFNISNLGIKTPVSVSNLSDGVHNVDVVQASDGAIKQGDAVLIKDAWNNGLSIDATAAVARVIGTFAASTNATSATGTVTLAVDYQESVDGPIGVQYLTFGITSAAEGNMGAGTTARIFRDALNTAISNNVNLAGKVSAATATGGTMHINTTGSGAGYSVNVASMTTTGNVTLNFAGGGTRTFVGENARGTSVNDTLQVSAQLATAGTNPSTWNNVAFAVNGGAATTINTSAQLLTIMNTSLKTAFGTVHDGTGASASAKVLADTVTSGGQTSLKIYTVDEGSYFYLGFNDTSTSANSTGSAFGITTDAVNNTGQDALVSLDGYINTINRVDFYQTTANQNSVTLYDSGDTASRGSVSMTVDNGKTYGGINVGNVLLDVDASVFSVRLDGGPAYSVTAGEWSTIFDNTGEQSIKVNYDLTSAGGTEQMNVTDSALVFQIGGNVGQTAKIGIQNMDADYLGKNVTGNQFNSLSKISVTSADQAQDAQVIIDAAIDEVTNVRGTLGSFQRNTLESNLANLRIAAQNLTAAESSIRDTDMAQEMSSFVRYQILLQAGTAMLAQGNQVPQVVLSLFR